MSSQISRVPFHSVQVVTLSGVTGNSTFPVNPQSALLGALDEVGDQFDLFRVEELKYRIHPMDPTLTSVQGASYYPDVDIQTQTIAQLASSPLATLQTPFCGVPSTWSNVPRASLKGMLDWYKCSADSGAAEFESQGLLQLVGGLSNVITIETRGVCLFKNPVSSALQMERCIQRAVKNGTVVRVPSPLTKTVR